MSKQYQNFKQFWPFYVSEHQNPLNRKLHFVGTGLGILSLATFFITRKKRFLAAAPVCGYLFAWIGHFAIEKNKPASFKYPGKSLISDFKMFGLILQGKMDQEVEQVQQAGHSS